MSSEPMSDESNELERLQALLCEALVSVDLADEEWSDAQEVEALADEKWSDAYNVFCEAKRELEDYLEENPDEDN